MNFEQVLDSLHMAGSLATLQPHWEESEAPFPPTGPPFLQPAAVQKHCEFVGISSHLTTLLLEAASRIRANPALLHLAWHCYRLLYHHLDYEGACVAKWPEPEEVLGELSGLFYMLIALAAIPLTLQTHRAQGLPQQMTRDCLNRFETDWVQRYRDINRTKKVGMPVRTLYWLRNYASGELFRLGRMEYMVRPFWNWVHVFRNARTNEVLAFAADGLRHDKDGFLDTEAAEEETWLSRFVIDKGTKTVRGFPISPKGHALKVEVEIPLTEWQPRLSPGDPVLDTHIPGGGGMTLAACADSHRQALEFFPRYFPDRPFKAIACASWILNPQLAEIYSPDSNMVLWQRELYLFPIPSGRKAGLFFIFGSDDVDPATAPRNTTLRRAILDHIVRGGRLIAGGMFLLPEDFKYFGTQFYRRHWPPNGIKEAQWPLQVGVTQHPCPRGGLL